MSDILKYRIPGQEVVSQVGYFVAFKEKSELSGFILTDFLLQKVFTFIQDDSAVAEYHFKAEVPFVANKTQYLTEAALFHKTFEKGKIKKAILSRIKEVPFDEDRTPDLFDSLCIEYPNAFVYLVSSAEFGTWVGATPEILMEVDNGHGRTMSLAGTKSAEDTTSWGEKEIKEQQYVTEFILEKLELTKVGNLKVSPTNIHKAGPVQHLRTDLTFDLGKEKISSLIQLLHPTPAVSGFPQSDALELIERTEQHIRDFYAGVIGNIGEQQARLFVNLRCCQVQRGKAYLYLGGGHTLDSDAHHEWEETENKAKTILNILQNI